MSTLFFLDISLILCCYFNDFRFYAIYILSRLLKELQSYPSFTAFWIDTWRIGILTEVTYGTWYLCHCFVSQKFIFKYLIGLDFLSIFFLQPIFLPLLKRYMYSIPDSYILIKEWLVIIKYCQQQYNVVYLPLSNANLNKLQEKNTKIQLS